MAPKRGIRCEYHFRIARLTACTLVALLAAAVIPACAESSLAETWEGRESGLPSVGLTIRNDNGWISGGIGYHIQTRGAASRWHPGQKTAYTVPLLSPKLEGVVLTFETIHHKKNGSPEPGPNDKYRVNFTKAKKARLYVRRDETKEFDS